MRGARDYNEMSVGSGRLPQVDTKKAAQATQRFNLEKPADPPDMGSETQRRREEQYLRALTGWKVNLQWQSEDQGGAYTDMKSIIMVNYDRPKDAEPAIQYINMRAQEGHEAGHLMYTDPKVFDEFVKKLDQIGKEEGQITSSTIHKIWNSLEDGMLEERLRTFEPGAYKWLSARNKLNPKVGKDYDMPETTIPPGMQWNGGYWPEGKPLSGHFDPKTGQLDLDPYGPPAPHILDAPEGYIPVDADGNPLQVVSTPDGDKIIVYPGTKMPCWTDKPVSKMGQMEAAILASALPEYQVGQLHPDVQNALDAVEEHIDPAVRGNTSDCVVRAVAIYEELKSRGLVQPELTDEEKADMQKQMQQAMMQAMMGAQMQQSAPPQMPNSMNLFNKDQQQGGGEGEGEGGGEGGMPSPMNGMPGGSGSAGQSMQQMFGQGQGSSGQGSGEGSEGGESGQGGGSGGQESQSGQGGAQASTDLATSGPGKREKQASGQGGSQGSEGSEKSQGQGGGSQDSKDDSKGSEKGQGQGGSQGSESSEKGQGSKDDSKSSDKGQGQGEGQGGSNSSGNIQSPSTSGLSGKGVGGTGGTGGPNNPLPPETRAENERRQKGSVSQSELDSFIEQARQTIQADKAAQAKSDRAAQAAGRVGNHQFTNSIGVTIKSQQEMMDLGRRARSNGSIPNENMENIAGQMATMMQQIKGQARAKTTRRKHGRLDARRFGAAMAGDQKVFYKPGVNINTDAMLIDVIDVSGSVSHEERRQQYQASKATAMACLRAGVKYTAIAYHGGGSHTEVFSLKDPHSKDISGLDGLLSCGGGGTPTTEGVELARAIAATSKSAHTIINVQTDGGANNVDTCRAQIEAARQSGYIVVGQCYGHGIESKMMDEQFGTDGWKSISNLGELPRIKMGLILNKIRSGSK